MGKYTSKTGFRGVGRNRLIKTYGMYQEKDKKIEWKPQPGGQTLFCNTKADIAIYGGAAGAGKTSALLIDCANSKNLQVEGYNATIFRRTLPQATNPGGLLDESRLLYGKIQGKLRLMPLDWTFLSNTKISIRALQYEKTVHEFQGSQICKLCFDELTHFSKSQFFYMLSRNRSACGVRPTVRATCNPDADSWVAELISWWINPDTGLPIKERRGVIRYFVRLDEEIFWADTPKELIQKYGAEVRPRSFTFIYGTIADNKKLLEADPNYISNLQALHPVEKERLLYGNWKIRLEAGVIFDRSWFKIISELPEHHETECITVRFWDFAGTSKDTARSLSDFDKAYYTASMKMVKIDNLFYIVDCQWDKIKGGNINAWLIKLAVEDGETCLIRWELEGGSSGKIVAQTFEELILEVNPDFQAEAIKPLGDKVTRALSAATAASNGYVYILDRPWTQQVLNFLEKFDGSRQPLINDVTDALSGAYHELENAVVYDFDDSCLSSTTPQYAENDTFVTNKEKRRYHTE